MSNIIQGRLCLSDEERKFSKLGVFQNYNDGKYICFENVVNSNGKTPVFLRINEENQQLVDNQVSVGDIIEISGEYGEINGRSYFIGEKVNILSKCVKGRKSDIFEMGEKSRKIVRYKSQIIRSLRRSMDIEGITEVITPTLLDHYEGGDAPPFETTNREGETMYLKETSELILRRLISLETGPVYEIGHSFRNIGTNKNSLQEFTVFESAIPFNKLEQGVDLAERILRSFLSGFDESKSLTEQKWDKINFLSRYKEISGLNYVPDRDYKQSRKDMSLVIDSIREPSFLIGLPIGISPINSNNGINTLESVLIINGNVYCDICEFETSKKDLEIRLKEQQDRNGRLNTSLLKFADEGLTPGIGIGFGIDRWVKYLTNYDILNIKNLGVNI